jgi:predicted lipoprotein
MNYRCPSKLREQIQSLSGEINRYVGSPTEGQKLRVREVTEETDQAVTRLNGIISGPIAEINSALASMPHVVAAPVK